MQPMSEDVYVDLQYQGIDLGNRLALQDFTASNAYLQCPQPMPVGTHLVLLAGEALEIPVRVVRVIEQITGIERPAGMGISAEGLEGAALLWWASHVPEATADSTGPDTDVMNAVRPEEVAEAKAALESAETASATTLAVETEATSDTPQSTPEPAKGKKRKRRRRQTRTK